MYVDYCNRGWNCDCISHGDFLFSAAKIPIFPEICGSVEFSGAGSLTGMMVVRAFNQQNFEEKRFDKANNDVTTVSLFINRIMAMLFPLMMLVMYLVIISITWVGSNQVGNGTLQVGGMIVFMQYTILIVIAFIMLSIMFITIPRAVVSSERIAEVLKKNQKFKILKNQRILLNHSTDQLSFVMFPSIIQVSRERYKKYLVQLPPGEILHLLDHGFGKIYHRKFNSSSL